jgi:septum formation protein
MMLQRPSPRLILASSSSSRRVLLESAGLAFDVQPADIDEAAVKRKVAAEGIAAEAAALLLADLKASEVAGREPDAMVIGADQILVCEGAWFDKPADLGAAREQLRALRGRYHTLATAVVCHRHGRQVWSHTATPHLKMRDFSDEFLECYLLAEAEAVTSTVGAYRLEGPGVHLFSEVDGSHSAILGLPLLPLMEFLRNADILTP